MKRLVVFVMFALMLANYFTQATIYCGTNPHECSKGTPNCNSYCEGQAQGHGKCIPYKNYCMCLCQVGDNKFLNPEIEELIIVNVTK